MCVLFIWMERQDHFPLQDFTKSASPPHLYLERKSLHLSEKILYKGIAGNQIS